MTDPTIPDPRRPARGYTARELADELVRRFGPAEALRQLAEHTNASLSFDTIEDLWKRADEADAELSR